MIGCRRRYFTLIEVLIALSLTVVVVFSLTFFFHQIEEINLKAERQQQQLFEQRYVGARLFDILPTTFGPPHQGSASPFYFSGSEGSLLFSYHAGAQMDTDFAGPVVAKLWVNNAGVLMLARWPIWKRWNEFSGVPPIKLEQLLQNVRSLNFSYYIPPGEDPKIGKLPAGIGRVPLPESRGWIPEEWKSDYFQLPALVKLRITMVDGSWQTHLFPLVNSDFKIAYEEGK